MNFLVGHWGGWLHGEETFLTNCNEVLISTILPTLLVQASTCLKRVKGEFLFHGRGAHGPVSGKAINEDVFKPHGGMLKKSGDYTACLDDKWGQPKIQACIEN